MRKLRDAKHVASKKAASQNTARTVTDHARDLKRLITDMGRFRSLRDPLAHLAPDLTPPQMHCVMWLGLEGALPSRLLAERIGCGQPTVTGIVDRLEKSGLVARERGTDDRRVVRVTLTDAGSKLYRALDSAVDEQLQVLMSLLNEKDRTDLLRIIGVIVDRMRAAREQLAQNGKAS